MKQVEIRTYRSNIEFREAQDKSSVGVLVGYAAKFNKESRNLGGFVEEIAPGAFNKSLADGVRVMARYNHDDMALLGATDSGTLRIATDGVGLMYEIDLPDTEMGRTCRVLAQRGDLKYSSFAFHIPPGGDDWGFTENDFPKRTLRSVQLVDVAPVNDPAYLDTSSGLRSFANHLNLDIDVVRAAAADGNLRSMMAATETPKLDTPGLDEARAALAARVIPSGQP